MKSDPVIVDIVSLYLSWLRNLLLLSRCWFKKGDSLGVVRVIQAKCSNTLSDSDDPP